MSIFWQIKEFGVKVAINNLLISIFKKIIGAKRIQITYWKK
jgi:hypothetical protein